MVMVFFLFRMSKRVLIYIYIYIYLTVIIGSNGPKISSVMMAASTGGSNNMVGSMILKIFKKKIHNCLSMVYDYFIETIRIDNVVNTENLQVIFI